MEHSILNTLLLQRTDLSYADFNAIVDEINQDSSDTQQSLNDMLDMMNQLKYQYTIQNNIKKHLVEKVHDKSCKQPVDDEPICASNKKECDNRRFIKSEQPKSNPQKYQDMSRELRFKKPWMTELIYEFIQARNRFSVAIRLHPDCKYLKSQQRYYKIIAEEAVQRQKTLFFSNKLNSSIVQCTPKPNDDSSIIKNKSHNESPVSNLANKNINQRKFKSAVIGPWVGISSCREPQPSLRSGRRADKN